MINVDGNISIRLVPLRNGKGSFKVGKLQCEVGEFAVKSNLIEELEAGSYRGKFTVSKIYLSGYSASGRYISEVRADVVDMALSDAINTTPPAEPLEVDPLQEECAKAGSAVGIATDEQSCTPIHHSAPTQLEITTPVDPATDANAHHDEPDKPGADIEPAIADDTERLKKLFGNDWPLGNAVKVDTTIDRGLLRNQIAALRDMGYEYNFGNRTYVKATQK